MEPSRPSRRIPRLDDPLEHFGGRRRVRREGRLTGYRTGTGGVVLAMLLLAGPLGLAAVAQPQESWKQVLVVRVGPPGMESFELQVDSPPGWNFGEVVIPDEAAVDEVVGLQGPVGFSVSGGKVLLSTPQQHVLIRGQRTSEVLVLGKLYTSWISVGTFRDVRNDVSLFVEVPDGYEIFAVKRGNIDPTLRRASTTLAAFTIAYEAPDPPDVRTIDAGPFRFIVRAAEADGATSVGKIAGTRLGQAATEAGLRLPWPGPIRVVSYDQANASSELGLHKGYGIAYLNRRVFLPATDPLFPLKGATALLHEAFHAISLPHAVVTKELDFFIEGSARFAEAHLEPLDGTKICSNLACTGHTYYQSQLSQAELEVVYASESIQSILSWSPSYNDGGRDSLMYAYGAFVIRAYIDKHGTDAYRSAWLDFTKCMHDGEPGCDGRWLLSKLASKGQAGTTAEGVLFPMRLQFQQDRQAFRAATSHLVAHEERAIRFDATQWRDVAETWHAALSEKAFAARSTTDIRLPDMKAPKPSPSPPTPSIPDALAAIPSGEGVLTDSRTLVDQTADMLPVVLLLAIAAVGTFTVVQARRHFSGGQDSREGPRASIPPPGFNREAAARMRARVERLRGSEGLSGSHRTWQKNPWAYEKAMEEQQAAAPAKGQPEVTAKTSPATPESSSKNEVSEEVSLEYEWKVDPEGVPYKVAKPTGLGGSAAWDVDASGRWVRRDAVALSTIQCPRCGKYKVVERPTAEGGDYCAGEECDWQAGPQPS